VTGKVKRETNKIQIIGSLFHLSISACFGHHYTHLQEYKFVYYRIWCSALVVLALVVCSLRINLYVCAVN